MKRASYRYGVEWIALNDNPAHHDEWVSFAHQVEEVAGYLSVALLADLFDKDPEDVARSVVRFRVRNEVGG